MAAVVAAPPRLRVRVRNLAGKQLELEVEPSRSVRELKQVLAEHFAVPPMCQRLIFSSEPLQDAEKLGELCQDASECLSMMLVVALDEARKQLANSSKRVRQEALHAFAQVAPRGNRGAVAAVIELLADSEPEVRASALRSLAYVAEEGNERALAAAAGRSKDKHPEVRRSALQALARMVPASGGQSIMEVAGEGLADRNKGVRQDALELFPRAALAEGAVDVLAGPLGHAQPEVRLAALRALASVGREAGERAVSAASNRLEDPDFDVKQEALQLLSRLVPSKDQRAVVAAVAKLRNGHTAARNAAMASLAKATPEGKSRAVVALSAAAAEPGKGLKAEALKALTQVAERGDGRATAAALQCLEDSRPEVRFAAVRTLPQLVEPGDWRTLTKLVVLAEAKDKGVRRDAQQVLGQVAPTEDERLVVVAMGQLRRAPGEAEPIAALAERLASGSARAGAAVVALLEDPSHGASPWQVLSGLARVALSPDPRLVQAVSGHLRHEEPEVRFLAVRVLAQVAPRGEASAVEAIVGLLEDAREEVRLAALEALLRVAPRGHGKAVAGLLGSARWEVRVLALRALAQLAAAGDARAVSAAKLLAEDSHEKVRREALVTLAALAPEGRENLALVAASAQRAAAAANGLRPMRKAVSLAALNVLGQTSAREPSPASKFTAMFAEPGLPSERRGRGCRQVDAALTASKAKRAFEELILGA